MNHIQLKESIIAEYLSTGLSFRKLGSKYGVNFRNVHRWVMQYQGRMNKSAINKRTKAIADLAKEALPTDVKQLQSELRKARLLNEVLTEVINIAEEELGLPIRKKSGTK
ncbi:MAG: transposase [Chryseotalea sp. WA131a]|jgi:transposase-like protein|nr:MAG: transposase [Chryseotalea sp. WA131a]